MIVVLINSCREVRFERKELLRPPSGPGEEQKKRYREDRSHQLGKCHNRLTVRGRARSADSTMALEGLQPRTASHAKNSLLRLAPIARIFL